MNIGIHVKYRLFLSDFSKNLIFWTDSNIKFHKNPSIGSRVFHTAEGADGRTDRQTDADRHERMRLKNQSVNAV